MSVPLIAFTLCICGWVKQLVVFVCCLSDQSKNWGILQFTGLTTIRLELKDKHLGGCGLGTRLTYRCVSDSGESGYSLPFLIRSQIESDRGQVYMEWTHNHCSIYADINMLSVTPSGLI